MLDELPSPIPVVLEELALPSPVDELVSPPEVELLEDEASPEPLPSAPDEDDDEPEVCAPIVVNPEVVLVATTIVPPSSPPQPTSHVKHATAQSLLLHPTFPGCHARCGWCRLIGRMPYVEYACEGRLLFRTETTEGAQFVPRVHEIVVIDDEPYQVVDVEYWARRMGATDRRFVWPTVYVIPVPSDEWELRLARRNAKASSGTPPVRY